jgi:hypothetical protein
MFFNVGRFVLLLITLGRYPRYHDVEKDVNKISLVGVAVVFLAWVAIALYNNYG